MEYIYTCTRPRGWARLRNGGGAQGAKGIYIRTEERFWVRSFSRSQPITKAKYPSP